MTNPVEAERRFLELQRRLNHNLSYRQQWLEIGDFLKLIEGHFATYDTHCEQLVEQMPVFTHPLSVTGTDPSQFEDILALLSALSESVPSLQHSRNFSEAKEALVVATVFQYLCLHQFESANRVLFGEQPEGLQKAVDIKDYLDKALGYVQSGATNLASGRIDRLKKWWGLVNEKSPSTLYVPVVEVSGPSEQGRLRKLTATVLSDNEEKDIFRNSYSVAGAEGEDAGIRPEVIEATRKLLEQSHSDLKQKFFNLQFEYSIPLGLHMGRSSDLACCLSAYSAMLNAVKSRERFEPGDRVAVTGRLGKRSRIEAVEAEGIAAKTRAAFFSWMGYLVVPEKQKHLFMEQLAILKEKYPAKTLKLIGLEEPKAFFYDRRISDHMVDSIPKHLAKQAWQQKFSLAGIGIIVVLLAVIGRLWYGPIDKNPTIGRFEGNQLHIYNNQNEKLTTYQVGSWQGAHQEKNNSNQAEPQVQFYDLDKDGINEVFWYQVPAEEIGDDHSLIAWSVSGDSLIWKTSLSFDINYPRKNSIKGNQFQLKEFHIEENEAGSTKIVANTNLLTFFPALIVTFDVDTGVPEQKYVHPGYFYDMAMHDVTGDGVAEVIATGVSNAFWKTAISVLEIDHLQGHAPTKGDYIVDDFKPAKQLHYILVPKTILGRYYDPISKYNIGRKIVVQPVDSLITIYIDDAQAPTIQEAKQPHVIINMNEQFQPVGIGTNDRYDILVRKLFQEEKIPFIPDYEYFEAFKDSLVYVEGENVITRLNK